MATLADSDGDVCHYYHLVPIGSIVAWHKTLTGVPALGEAWMECDGTAITDAESPMNGQNTPNLNGAVAGGLLGRFLRGDTTSGTLQADDNKPHTHDVTKATVLGGGSTYIDTNSSVSATGTEATSSTGTLESRPYNMTVVWIIRIK